LLEKEMFRTKFVEEIKTHVGSVTFFPPKILLWEIMVEPERPQVTTWQGAEKDAICMADN
jgi:hypothetical protein